MQFRQFLLEPLNGCAGRLRLLTLSGRLRGGGFLFAFSQGGLHRAFDLQLLRLTARGIVLFSFSERRRDGERQWIRAASVSLGFP